MNLAITWLVPWRFLDQLSYILYIYIYIYRFVCFIPGFELSKSSFASKKVTFLTFILCHVISLRHDPSSYKYQERSQTRKILGIFLSFLGLPVIEYKTCFVFMIFWSSHSRHYNRITCVASVHTTRRLIEWFQVYMEKCTADPLTRNAR